MLLQHVLSRLGWLSVMAPENFHSKTISHFANGHTIEMNASQHTHTHTHSLIRHRTYQWRNIMFYKVVSCTTDAFSDAASGEMTYFAVHLSQSGVENGFSCWREQNTFQFVETNNVGSTLLFGHHIYDFKFNWKQSQWIPLTNNATLHPSLLSTHFFAQPTKVLCTRFDRENGAKH